MLTTGDTEDTESSQRGLTPTPHKDPKARRIAKKAKEGTFFCDSSRLRVLGPVRK